MADGLTKKRITAYAVALGKKFGQSHEDIRTTARAAFLHDVESSRIPLRDVSQIVAAQRESYDGTGPKGLKGDAIPPGARILRLAYALDALLTGRPLIGGDARRFYRALSISEATERIQRASGTAFDPKVVDAFLAMPEWSWAQMAHNLPSLPGFG